MTFNIDDAFECREGLVIYNKDVGLFGGSTDPTGSDAPVGSRYYQTSNGNMWRKTGVGANDWVIEHEPGRTKGIDHNNLLGLKFPVNFKDTTYTNVVSGHIFGSLEYPPTVTFEFTTQAKVKDSANPGEIRLYDTETMSTIVTQTIDYTSYGFQRTAFTFNKVGTLADVDARVTTKKGKLDIKSIGVMAKWVQV